MLKCMQPLNIYINSNPKKCQKKTHFLCDLLIFITRPLTHFVNPPDLPNPLMNLRTDTIPQPFKAAPISITSHFRKTFRQGAPPPLVPGLITLHDPLSLSSDREPATCDWPITGLVTFTIKGERRERGREMHPAEPTSHFYYGVLRGGFRMARTILHL